MPSRSFVLYGEQRKPRFERAALRWLGRLFLEKPMPYALAATCVELAVDLLEEKEPNEVVVFYPECWSREFSDG